MDDKRSYGADVIAVQWEVRPDGIERTRLSNPKSFYLTVRRSRWDDQDTFVIVPNNSGLAFTRHGKTVWLRHDPNAKHAHFATFEQAVDVARAIVNGDLPCEGYLTWQTLEARLHGPVAETS